MQTTQPRQGDIRANATDYDGEIVVEMFGYYGMSGRGWHVPAWDERGEPDLAGPFASVADAERAVSVSQW